MVDHSRDALDIEGMFAQFKAAYPKRRGSNPSMPALKSFTKAVKRTDPRTIIDAARVYAAEQRSLGKENTEYVAQMSTWLNQERWRDYQKNGSPTKAMTWITMDDPRWRRMAGMYYAEKGTLPPHVSGLGGQGWRFPTAWITEEFGGGLFASPLAVGPVGMTAADQPCAGAEYRAQPVYRGAETNTSASPKD